MELLSVQIDGRDYSLEVRRANQSAAQSVKLLVPTFLVSDIGFHVARVCIESIKRFTRCEHEIWVIDNNSPEEHYRKLLDIDGINLVRNTGEPVNPRVPLPKKKGLLGLLGKKDAPSQGIDGSYANAIALEIGMRLINPDTLTVMALHSDTLVTKEGWLEYLRSKMNDRVRAVGCFRDNIRINALHISGLLFDFQLYKRLGVSMLPNIRQRLNEGLPEYDVGDAVSYCFEKNGYSLYGCVNTHNDTKVIEWVATGSVYDVPVVRVFNDQREVVFLHLGRGTLKVAGQYNKEGRLLAEEWVDYAEGIIGV